MKEACDNLPVDAVITWVDGYDLMHRKKLEHYLALHGLEKPESAIPTRYNQQGEINYCLKSIFKYAPWIRTLYLITDGQTPEVLAEIKDSPFYEKIILVDHRHIYRDYEANLPTFNSVSIESLLWRIEGLAEHFIYFNDDCTLVKPVAKEDFFKEGKVVAHGHWKVAHDKKRFLGWINRVMLKKIHIDQHRILQENSARLAGFEKYFFHLPHIPFALKKSTFSNYYSQNPTHLEDNIRYPFRDNRQYWPVSLAYHLELKAKTASISTKSIEIAFHAGVQPFNKIKRKLLLAERGNHVKFVCIQSLDEAPIYVRDYLLNWLKQQVS